MNKYVTRPQWVLILFLSISSKSLEWHQPYDQPRSRLLSIWNDTLPWAFISIVLVCYHLSIYHENLHSLCITFSALYVFICTCMLSYILDMQLTLPIHVNPFTAINSSHLLSPGAWHMTPIIGHQRRLTATILSKLTCDFRKLPPEHNIYPNILFPRMSSYCQTWLISLTFVLYAVKKHCETPIRFFVSVVREKYIEIVLLCHMMNFYSSKIAHFGSAGCAKKTFSPSII